MKFLRSRAASLGLPIEVIEVTSGKPVVIITWLGSQPELPSLLLNSHMDVVPVFAVCKICFHYIFMLNRPSVFKYALSSSYYILIYGPHIYFIMKLQNLTFVLFVKL